MKHKLFLLAFAALLTCTINCDSDSGGVSSSNEGNIRFAGYAYDITTGAQIQNYTITVDTPGTSFTGSIDADGYYKVANVPAGTDYIVNVASENYRLFKSTNQWEFEGNDFQTENSRSFFYNIPLVPATVIIPEIKISVYDKITGDKIENGNFRVTNNTTEVYNIGPELYIFDETDLENPIYSDSSNARWWEPDVNPVIGSITNGEIVIPEGSIITGYHYDISVFNAPGYYDTSSYLNFWSAGYQCGIDLTIPLVPIDNNYGCTSGIYLIAQSNTDINGDAIVTDTRTITFYFNIDIEYYIDNIKGIPGNDLISLYNISDNDGDETTIQLGTESLDEESYTSWVRYSQNTSNSLTLTFAADSQLLEVDDLDDDLAYSFYDLAKNIYVKSSGVDGPDVWKRLTNISYSLETEFIVRDNYASNYYSYPYYY